MVIQKTVVVPREFAEFQNHWARVKKLGVNENCWCGSGKKFKKCHREREKQTPLELDEVIQRYFRVFKKGRCFAPNASASTCSGNIIKAHTIRRSGDLKGISSKGHIYNCLLHGKLFDESKFDPESNPNRVGIREASTFAGFCEGHDNILFAPLEKEPFSGTALQIALLGYRAISHEIFLKECFAEQSELQRDLDRGKPPVAQFDIQRSINAGILMANRDIQELKPILTSYRRMLTCRRFDGLYYYVVQFGKRPDIVCSGTVQATHDFEGRMLVDLDDLSIIPSQISFSLFATDNGGVAVFSWSKDHKDTEQVITTLDELPNEELPHAIVRFAFEFFENTYFSPTWWDSLEKTVQIQLRKRQLSDAFRHRNDAQFPRQDSCLVDDGIQAVDWPVISRRLSISSV